MISEKFESGEELKKRKPSFYARDYVRDGFAKRRGKE